MISGMLPAGLKPTLKFAMTGQDLNEFAAILWGPNCTRGKIMGFNRQEHSPSDNNQINALR
jgi:hypothetical protein